MEPTNIAITLGKLIQSMAISSTGTYILYFINREYHKHKLLKNFDTGNVDKVIISPAIKAKFDDVNMEKIPTLFRNKIKEFVEKLEKIVPKEYLQNFYNNINEAKIGISPKLAFSGCTGAYDVIDNKLGLSLSGLFLSINHELLHLASSYTYRDKTGELELFGCGFTQYNKDNFLGRGLTEGYTEYLDKKYFSHDKINESNYKCLAQICEFVQLLVGEDIMKESYFSSNLKNLITYLGLYNTKENINTFIQDCDFLFNFYGQNNLLIKSEKQGLEEKLKRVYKFIITSYYIKTFYIDRGDRYIYSSDKERESKYAEFMNKIPRTLKAGIKSYDVVNDNDIMDAVNDAKYLIETENIRLAEYSRR